MTKLVYRLYSESKLDSGYLYWAIDTGDFLIYVFPLTAGPTPTNTRWLPSQTHPVRPCPRPATKTTEIKRRNDGIQPEGGAPLMITSRGPSNPKPSRNSYNSKLRVV